MPTVKQYQKGGTYLPSFEKGGQKTDKERQAHAFFTSQGWTPEQSIGIIGNIRRESSFNPEAVGDAGKAFGLIQWHPDRQARAKALYGDNWKSFENQLRFIDWELKNTEKDAGNRLKNSKGVWQAGQIVSDYYERPKIKFAGDETRQTHVADVAMKFKGIKLTPEDNINYGVTFENSVAPYMYAPQKPLATIQIPEMQTPQVSYLDTPQETTNLAEQKQPKINPQEEAFMQDLLSQMAEGVGYVEPQKSAVFQDGGRKDSTAKELEKLKKNNPTLYKEVERNNRRNESTNKWNQHFEEEKKKEKAKEWVQNSMQEAYKHPLMSPGYFTPEGMAIGAMQGAVKLPEHIAEGDGWGVVGDVAMMLPFAPKALKVLGAKEGLLSNTYKLNPKAITSESFNNPNSFYRQIDTPTFNEGLESGLIKGKQSVNKTQGEGLINLNKSFGDDAYYFKGKLYSPQRADYIYEVNKGEEFFKPRVNNKDYLKKGVPYTVENTNVRVSKTPIPLEEATIYKKDWLQGYRQIQPQFQQGGKQVIKDNNGYWNPQNWGKVVEIDSPQISMKNVSQTLLGVADTGERKIMKTDNEYNFKGASKVTEIPLTKAEENFLKDIYETHKK